MHTALNCRFYNDLYKQHRIYTTQPFYSHYAYTSVYAAYFTWFLGLGDFIIFTLNQSQVER